MTWDPPHWWVTLTGSVDPSLDIAGLHLHGRPLMLAAVVAAVLAVTSIPVWLSRNSSLRSKWVTWVFIAVVAGPIMWIGPFPTAVLAAALSVACIREYGAMLDLPKADRILLGVFGAVFPFAALWQESILGLLPLLVLLAPIVAVLSADTTRGGERAGYFAFGLVWLAWAPAHLVLLYSDAFLIALAVAVTDVASWTGGKTLGRLPLLRRTLGPVSPNKTVGGLLGGALGAAATLAVLGEFQVGLFVAVAIGAPLGDLVESLFKRQARVKDAGAWLPGFGGLLDRVDSLLLVLPLAAVLSPVF